MKPRLLLFISFIAACSFLNNDKLVHTESISDNTTIELYYSGGGATAPDILWIKKLTKDGQRTLIGKINGFTDSDKVNIKRVDSDHITLDFVNERDFLGHPIVFMIDLNSKIERNADSPFNERTQ